MKVLVMGNGGREHAIVWKLHQSESVQGVYAYPGNAGTAQTATNLPVPEQDPDWSALIQTCRSYNIDWVFVGPEQPLSAGVVDALQQAGIPAFGPHQKAAELEASKAVSKQFMLRNQLPTAQAVMINSVKELEQELNTRSGMIVLKKSGLAAGKGVLESDNYKELLQFGTDILQNDSLIIEDYLTGYEVSLFTLSNGTDYTLLPACADYKKAGDGNTGLNTGGMGAVCPVPWFDSAALEETKRTIIEPTHAALAKEGLQYTGVLYFGVMVTENGPKLLEYNVRFGDPEAQIVLPLLEGDFGNTCWSLLNKQSETIRVRPNSSVTVVAAAPGYPGTYPKHIPVTIKDSSETNGTVFHASTVADDSGGILTNGGRCFTATGWGADTDDARNQAYTQLQRISFTGMWNRSDIGLRISQKA